MHRCRSISPLLLAQIVPFGIVVLCAAVGCGGSRLPTTPVEGKVLYNSKPLQFGSVMLQPDLGPMARGTIQPDGTFRLSTYGNGDGAVIGTHRVRVACFENQSPNAPSPDPTEEPSVGKSLIPRKYLYLDTSGLRVEVEPQNEPFVFELSD